ncbi:ribonuclease R [Salinisphaera sp. PC39]|uniref:ribonuclease R n=1 Tax=Salinisphaera sp. PC39 TaxID=1304156 RepID=UPI00333E23AC
MPKSAKSPGDWRKRDPEYSREKSQYRRPIPSRTLILKDLAAHGSPMSRRQIQDLYRLDEDDIEPLQHRISAMLRDGQLIENRKGALGPIDSMDLVRGRVQGHRDGFGFLQPDEGSDDVFLNPRQMRSLFHGDRAVVRIVGTDHKGRREGRLVEILERAQSRIVGRYTREMDVGIVIPDNTRISHDILVPEKLRGDAEDGQIVTVELVEQPGKRSQPIGEVVEILGEHMAPGMEIDIAVRAHGIPFRWPDETLAEAEAIGDEVPDSHRRGREDLRDLPLMTIDGADAKDFDDAVYAEPRRSGWTLYVAIADVSAYVEPGSALDDEARRRGTSVYFPEHVVPMLPEALSNGLCSLNPDVDRLCVVCEMRIDKRGKTTRSRFYPAVMRSHARLTYEEAAALIEDPKARGGSRRDVAERLGTLHDLYQVLAKARRQRGAIDFETTETRIVFNEQRKIERIEPVVRNDAHRLIEECMIAANVATAKHLTRAKMPMLYRVHTAPEADRLAELREFLAERGLGLGGGDKPQAEHFARVIEQVRGRDDEHLVQTVLLRTLSRAVYSPDNEGHFGLALEHYAHFTSPIRRYPDLLVHRAIKHVHARRKPVDFDYGRADMEQLGAACSAAEQRADEATRDVDDWLKCEYMRDHIGEVFDGTIVGVTAFGLFVELDGIYATGLVHVSSLSNDFYHFDPAAHCLRGERSGIVHRLADRMRVKVARVDLDERKIDFEPMTAERREGGKGRRKRGKRSGGKR